MVTSDDTLQGNNLRDVIENRKTTLDLIKEQGRLITLHRPSSPVADGAGGQVLPDNSTTAQPPVRRFFSLVLQEPVESGQALVGEALHARFVLIGRWDDDIQEGDYCILGNKRYVVFFVHPDETYQVKAEGECVDDGRNV